MGYIVNMLPRYLARTGAEVHYITMDMPHYAFDQSQQSTYSKFDGLKVMRPGEEESFDGFRLHCLGHRSVAGHPRFVGLKRKLQSIRPDVVQSFLSIGWVALDSALLRSSLGYSLFTAAHTTASVFPLANRPVSWANVDMARNFVTRWIPGRYVSRKTDKCYAATVDCGDVAQRFFGVEREKIEIVPLGVDTELMSPAVNEEQRMARLNLRASLGFAPDDVVYIYTGQFTEAKNPLLLATAVESIRSKGGKVRGLFLGDGVQRDAIVACRQSVVLPFVPHKELPNYYRAAEVGVWPTQESTSMLDAAACGLPIVVNDTLRAVERISGNGVTYRLNDLHHLEKVLSSLMDSEARLTLGRTGAVRIAKEFSWSSLAARRVVDYCNSLEGKPKSASQC
jgi:glycosyltransferase involved in cell wall biosynthesis